MEPLQKAAGQRAEDALAQFYLGEALNHVDQLAPALTAYERAARLDPTNWRAFKGVGIVLDLGGPREVDSLRVRLAGQPTSLSIYAASPDRSRAPRSLSGLPRVARIDGAGTDASVSLGSGIMTRYVVVWLRSLPSIGDNEFGGEIREVVVRGRS